jgi:hypothetical protein
VTRVNSTNVLDEGLRIGGRGRRMNSKVKISQTRSVSRISVVLNLAQSQSVPGRPLLVPIYIGGQVSRNRSGSIQITISIYDTNSYFDYDYIGPSLTGLRGTQIMCSISYTLVTMVLCPFTITIRVFSFQNTCI